jgi:murein DD-endopeptidase MepM/ murein hydrolase activator NlpD
MAKELKTRRDTGDLEEGDVLKVLDSAGIGQSSFAAGFRPFEVRVYRGLWLWPLRAGLVSSEFGRRWGRQHQGVDIAADLGVPVRAVAPGEVVYAGDELRGYGNVVIVRHDNETSTLYAHNDSIEVEKGQRVRTGQVIARLGNTGHSTGPHLHFEIRKKNKPVDPRKVLPKSRF